MNTVQRAFLAYIRSEGDEADVIRLCQAALSRGAILTPLEAATIWQWYSEAFYAAGWMEMDDHGVDRALTKFFDAFGGAPDA